MKILIFFDINGTLIERDARTDLPFEEAINTLLNVTNALDGVNTAARSDKDVFIEVLSKRKIDFSEPLFEELLSLYKSKLEAYKTTDVWRENVDAVSFVKSLVNLKASVDLALITGELSMGAQYKLEKIGIYTFFPVGGFGEDGLTRFEIAECALKKAKSHYGSVYDKVIVIGDTVLDIQTARHIGAKAIAIATGAHTKDQLAEYTPDLLIETFSEIQNLHLI